MFHQFLSHSTKENAASEQIHNRPRGSLFLGHYFQQMKNKIGRPLYYAGERHLLLVGPNGSGKATRLLVPNLLSIKDRSVIVIDPKGELAAITARYRRSVSDVYLLNPFDSLGLGGSGYNPLSSLDPSAPTYLDDCMALGEALIKIESKDPHWTESAQALLVALIMWEVELAKRQGRLPDLFTVRRQLTEPEAFVVSTEGDPRLVKGLRHHLLAMVKEGVPEIESLIGRFIRPTDEIKSVISTADTQTRWLLSNPIRQSLVKNDLDFSELKKKPITVYLILPAERLRTHSIWLRLILTSALRALSHPGGLSTLFILDEFAQLGYLGSIEDAYALVRGFGIQLWPIIQDLSQLKALYKDRWETFMANAGIIQGFAPHDLTTAEWMSKRAGQTTDVVSSVNQSDSQSFGGRSTQSNNFGKNLSLVKRPFLLPQELMGMPLGAGVLYTPNSFKTIPYFGFPYWQLPQFKERSDPNPYYQRENSA